MEMLYLKNGRRYVPVEPFTGWPADGVWLVRKEKTSSTLIAKLDDLHGIDLRKLGDLAQAHDIITNILVETMDGRHYTCSDLADKIIVALSKFTPSLSENDH